MMKKKYLALTLLLGFFIGSPVVYGFKQASIEQLLRTKSCPKCDLYKANLDAIDLSYANLRGANLKRAKFRKATLYGADLSGANTYGTNFEGAMWIDGTICLKGSIGYCVKPEK